MTKRTSLALFSLGSVFLVLQVVIRLALAITGPVEFRTIDMLYVLGAGAVNDLIVLAYLLSPICFVLILFDSGTAARRTLLISWLAALIVISVIATFGDFFFWSEFESRPDRLVFHYLRYPVEVAAFLEEQFYLSLLVLPFGLIVWLCMRLLNVPLESLVAGRIDTQIRVVGAVVLALLWGLGPAAFSTGPLQIGQSRHLTALSSNSYFSVFHAAAIVVDEWHLPRMDDEQAQQLVSGAFNHSPVPESERLSLKGKNVILIIEESFAGETWQDAQKRQNYLPALDQWAGTGTQFRNVFSTGSRTTRGMEAIFHGVPPLPGISLTQREGFSRLPSLPRSFQASGYETLFLYGGWPNFSDFASYWAAIGFQSIQTKNDFTDRWFETSWGVADEILFAKLLQTMDEKTTRQRPIFISTLTVSNHRPFDVPAGKTGFPADERSLDYAMAYADWALGDFLTRASQRPWYAETLIVIVADHGPRPTGNASIPVSSFRVPLVLLGGGMPVGEFDNRGSTMDIPVTLSRLLGLQLDQASQQFWGNDLLLGADGIALVEHDYHVGVLSGKHLSVLKHDGSAEGWLERDDRKFSIDRISAAEINLGRAIFQTAHGRFYGRN